MVADKMHSRGTGPSQHLVRQPASGRANKGGLRIGEMERDSIISHGISKFLNESIMERSDKFKVQIDTTSGMINYDDKQETKINVEIPYCMKLLIQELETMNVATRLITDNTISNIPVFQHLLNNMSKYSIDQDLSDEEEEQEPE